jgi:hypothetical protein
MFTRVFSHKAVFASVLHQRGAFRRPTFFRARQFCPDFPFRSHRRGFTAFFLNKIASLGCNDTEKP